MYCGVVRLSLGFKKNCALVKTHALIHSEAAANFHYTITTFQLWFVNPGGCYCSEYYFHWVMLCRGLGFVNIFRILSQLSHVLNTGKSLMQKPRLCRLHELH